MNTPKTSTIALLIVSLFGRPVLPAAEGERDFSPGPQERQLPRAMHSPMDERPRITVGVEDADINGRDGRVLQAAVDYIAALGGGTVEVQEGTFVLHDSLHIPSGVTVRGIRGKTRLQKAPSVGSPLAIDGDFGEEQITVMDPTGFDVGGGVAIWDDQAGGFHTTVARITGKSEHRLSLSEPLMADCLVSRNAQAATVFPVISSYDSEGVVIEGITIDGNRDSNVHLNGCRGAGIFLYRAHGAVLRDCDVRDYNGDGISFQQSNDVTVTGCLSDGNASLGIHPGSGSQRPVVRNCSSRKNGTDGLFLCWRVRHGLFEDNICEQNGRFGISIGHKDSDNLLRRNVIRSNASSGVFFRNETLGMAAHRNVLEDNRIEDNGGEGIRIRGETRDLTFLRNRIRDTREESARTQTVGVLVEEKVGEVTLQDNDITADRPVVDRRP